MVKNIKKKKNGKSNFSSSFSRMITLTKKNLLRFWQNPRVIVFMIGMPLVYYLLIGMIFGSMDEDTLSDHNIGWVDDDTSTADHSTHPNFDLDFIHDLFDDIDEMKMHDYSSKDDAIEAAIEEEIDAFIYFPEGYEAYLEKNAYVDIAFWQNDSSSSSLFNVSAMLENLKSQTSTSFKITNITTPEFFILMGGTFQSSDYDGILILNNNFSKGLDNDWNVNMSFFFRDGLSYSKLHYINNTIPTTCKNFFKAQGYNSSITLPIIYPISGSSIPIPVKFEIYFLQSISPTTKSIIQSVVSSIISETINSNPLEIDVSYEIGSAVGEEANNITFQAPGLILYGPMTILSFAIVVITSEKKDGIYKRLSTTEVKNWEIVLSSILVNIILVFMQFTIGAIIMFLFGWEPIIASLFDAILGIVITIFLFSFFILALSFCLTSVFKDPDSAGGGVWIVLIPLMMLSGIFFPIEFFGESMQEIAKALPTRYAVLALQGVLLKGLTFNDPSILWNYGVLAIFSILLFAIGIKAFNKFKR